MHTYHPRPVKFPVALRYALAVAALVVGRAPVGYAQSIDFEPAALGKQRTALYLKATRAPLTELEGEVNHLAVLSETCRAEHGAKACGLPEKPLAFDKLEERYAYYVRQPLEARLSGQGMKVNRRNWEGPESEVRSQESGARSQ